MVRAYPYRDAKGRIRHVYPSNSFEALTAQRMRAEGRTAEDIGEALAFIKGKINYRKNDDE